jgi:hypothetical protein
MDVAGQATSPLSFVARMRRWSHEASMSVGGPVEGGARLVAEGVTLVDADDVGRQPLQVVHLAPHAHPCEHISSKRSQVQSYYLS